MTTTPNRTTGTGHQVSDGDSRRVVWLARAAVAAQLLFVGGWLVGGAIEGHGYSPGLHDISDLGALTAQHAWLYRLTVGMAGATTIAFALFALAPSLRLTGRRPPVSAWLVALSLPGFDTLTDAFFRLDCRAADAGCSTADAAASWHGKAHLAWFAVSAVATVVAPFALAHRMGLVAAWHDLARPTRVFGVVTVLALVATAAAQGTAAQGWSQRVAAVIVPLGVVALALRVLRIARPRPRP